MLLMVSTRISIRIASDSPRDWLCSAYFVIAECVRVRARARGISTHVCVCEKLNTEYF